MELDLKNVSKRYMSECKCEKDLILQELSEASGSHKKEAILLLNPQAGEVPNKNWTT
jgi:hypothetical protein